MVKIQKNIGQSFFLLVVIASSLIGKNNSIKVEAFSSDLFIRSVYHNASNDNMLEVFNGTGAAVNLNNYYVSAFHNGSPTPTATHRLSNIDLPNGQAFLLGKDSSTGPYTTAERAYVNSFSLKLLLPNGVGFQNASLGNDAFALRKTSSSGTIIDVFGMIGYNPNTSVGWTEHNSTLRYGYVDPSYVLDAVTKPGATNFRSSLIRRPDVINPQVSSLTYKGETATQSFKPSEWGVYNVGTFAGNVDRFNLFDDVNDVITLINNLPNPITQNDGEAVAAARTAYDALTSAQKGNVTNYADLQADEATIAGFAEIIEVIDLINAIPDPLTLADESFVTTAKTAFDALSASEQLQVTNRQELTDAITHINNLKAVQQIITDINGLPSVITLGQADAITSIREDYEALPLAQQELISNYATFVTKETEYLRLKGIDDVEALIDALPVPVSLTDGVQLANARTAYNLLASADQAQVGNYALLTSAENHYLDLQASQAVINQIAAIADPITLASRDAVTAARTAFGLLTSTQQDLVSNEQRLIDVEAIITGLLDEVDEVISAIDVLPDPVAITNQGQLLNAESAFEALSDDQAALVTNEPDLTQARTQMDAILAKIQDVISKIDLIVDPVTLAQTSTIETARTAFDVLTADEKVFVTNDIKLFLAEDVIIDLNTPRYTVTYVVFNQIFSETVKSGTSVQSMPTSLTRLGYTFSGWVLEGTTTLIDLSTYIVTSAQRLVAVFNVDPTSNASEVLVDIDGLNQIDVATLFPNREVSLQMNIDAMIVEDVPVQEVTSISQFISTQTEFTLQDIFYLDLSIVVTYIDNGISVEETLTEIDTPVEITISIPNVFRNFASYQIVRVHEGVSSFLDTLYDATAKTLTFSTDKFSTYGVLYSNEVTDDLMSRIDAIPVPATLQDLATVQAIRTDYDNLTPAQQDLITNIQLLIDAEATLQDLQDEIDAVIALINLLGNPTQLFDEPAIQAARSAYDALAPLQQALVTNSQDLIDAENGIVGLYAGIDDVILQIDSLPNPIQIVDETTVEGVRTAYESLTLEQQAYVTNLIDLQDAETGIIILRDEIDNVLEMIDNLQSPVLVAYEFDIDAARLAYDALTDEQKTYITNLSILTTAEADYQTLLDEIDDVMEMINDLQSPVMLAHEADIEAAREAYDALTEEQKIYVLNYSTLTTAEADYQTLLDEIDAVIELINHLETPVLIAHEADIEAARAAYDVLTSEQQLRITNYSTLTDAETDLVTLYAEIAAVNLMISDLNDPVTLEDNNEVMEALEAYDDLTTEQQGYVIGFSILNDANEELLLLKANIIEVQALIDALDGVILIADEAAIEEARTAYDNLSAYEKTFIVRLTNLSGAETDLANLYAEIEEVNALILALNDPITLADELAILTLREAYDALTEEQQSYVTNLADLTNAEADFQLLIDEIDAVMDLIINLDNPVMIADEDDIEAVRTAYDALSLEQQARVINYTTLTEAETDLATLYAEIEVVNNLIGELNDPITLEDDQAVLEAQEAYDALTDEQKTYIDGFPTLEAAIATIDVLKADINAVIALINGLYIPITLSQETAIEEARTAFEELTTYEKTFVNNILDLVDAEADYQSLLDEIDAVIALILDLNDPITIADEQAILEVREAFDDLTTEQQTFIVNLSDLTDAEAELVAIQARIDAVIQLIIELEDPIRIADEAAIEAARTAYLALSILERTYVTNVSDLIGAENDLATLYAEIEAVNNMIENLSDPINLDDEEALLEAREAYGALTEEQQAFVNQFPSLEQAEEDLQTLLDEIDAVIALIEALPNPITLDDLDLVAAIREAFNDLNELQQARVNNDLGLLNAESRLIDLAIAETVSIEIMDLPLEQDVTLADQTAIESAREAYDGLTQTQRGMVSGNTLQHLIDAENALQRLLNPSSGLDGFSLLPFHLASGIIIALLFFIKSKRQGA
jgi:hypothetical protein